MSSETDKPDTHKKTPAKNTDAVATAPTDIGVRAILELKDSLVALQQHNESRMSAQESKLAGLYEDLTNTFTKIRQDTDSRQHHHSATFDELSTTLIRSSEEMRKEYEELERLQEKRIAAESQQYSHSITRTKIVAIPAMILAFIALVYMFYTVNVMEKAMTQMSQDMSIMRQDMGVLTQNVSSMSTNMAGMRYDMNIMTHNVAPAMHGMRQMMPWTP